MDGELARDVGHAFLGAAGMLFFFPLAVRRLARDAAPGALHDLDGQAFARLGVDGAAQYLVRPDGHVGYRIGGTALSGVERYLARSLPHARGDPDRTSHDAPTTTHD